MNRVAKRGLLAAGLVVALIGAGAWACDIQPTGSVPGKTCATEVIEPVVSPDFPESIEAVSRSECSHAPLSHRVSLYIEEQLPGGIWAEVESMDLNHYTLCEEVPGPGHDVGCTRLVPCLDGTYRSRATVYGSGETASGDVESFSYETPPSREVRIDCPA